MRGLLDLVTGCYPSFLFGGPVSALLPVFHLHESDPAVLESRLAYAADNGYRTVTTDAIARFVLEGVHPGPRTVALCFDDCWATLWTVAGPLLRRYGMSAIGFAIPGRVTDAAGVRPTIEEQPESAVAADWSDVPFATWPELRSLQASGLIDIQSHTRSHSAIFAGPQIVDFVTPEFVRRPLLNRPRASAGLERPWLTPEDLGAPLHVQRSRMSDALRFLDDEAPRARCIRHVAESGGSGFFERPRWRAELTAIASGGRGRFETATDREHEILEELHEGRSMLEARLGTSVRHVCLPWGIAGHETHRALARTGHQLAFADRLFGRRAVAAGDNPHALMRLHERFLFCLPGRGRRWFGTAKS
jgi:hypothetical protein